MSYQPKTYRKQGGDEFVVASGGTITVESGGTLDVQAGATVNLPSGGTAAGDIALAQGSVIVGNASGYGAALSAKTDAYILAGNGTTVISVAVGGDVTMSNTGEFTVANSAITDAKLNTAAVTTTKIGGAAVTGAKMAATGVKSGSFTGNATNGVCTLAGAVAGDRVFAIFQIDAASGVTNTASSFESTISVNSQIQQTANAALNTNTFAVLLLPASA
jgi:hypothetical protein